MSARKLWKVVYGTSTYRPESKTKAYGIYVANAGDHRDAYGDSAPRFAEVYVDERDGQGWQRCDRIDLDEWVLR